MLPSLRLPMLLQVGRLSVAGSRQMAQISPPYQTIKVTQECLLLDSTGSRLAAALSPARFHAQAYALQIYYSGSCHHCSL